MSEDRAMLVAILRNQGEAVLEPWYWPLGEQLVNEGQAKWGHVVRKGRNSFRTLYPLLGLLEGA